MHGKTAVVLLARAQEAYEACAVELVARVAQDGEQEEGSVGHYEVRRVVRCELQRAL